MKTMNELMQSLIKKYNMTDEPYAEFLIKSYLPMYDSFLSNATWGCYRDNNSRPPTQQEKLQDCLQTTDNFKMVIEYVVRLNFPHLIKHLE